MEEDNWDEEVEMFVFPGPANPPPPPLSTITRPIPLNPTPIQPHLPESVSEKAVFIWEIHEHTFPAPLIPQEEFASSSMEPDGKDHNVSVFDLMEKVESSTFVRGQEVNRPCEWKLHVQRGPNQPTTNLEVHLTCLRCFLPDALPVWTRSSLEIIDKDGSPLKTSGSVFEAEPKYFHAGSKILLSSFSINELQARCDEFSSNGILRFRLRLNIYQPLIDPGTLPTSTTSTSTADEEICHRCSASGSKRARTEGTYGESGKSAVATISLLGTLECMWKHKDTTGDVIIRCKRVHKNPDEFHEEDIKAHKIVLSARSQVFLGMLDGKTVMREQQSNVIEIDDISPEMIENMLEFLYLDDIIRFDWHDVQLISELIYVADKYWITPLMTKCLQSLMKAMCLENFGRIAKVIFTYDCDKEFKDEVRHFYESHQITLNNVQTFRDFAHENFDEFYKLFFHQY